MMRERPGCVNYTQSRERLLSRKSGALCVDRGLWRGRGPGGWQDTIVVVFKHRGRFSTPTAQRPCCTYRASS